MPWLPIVCLRCRKCQFYIFGEKLLPKGDMGHIRNGRSDGAYDFECICCFENCCWLEADLNEGACRMGTMRLGAIFEFLLGGALTILRAILCGACLNLETLWRMWTFVAGTTSFFFTEKRGTIAFVARGTKFNCWREKYVVGCSQADLMFNFP